MMELLAVVAFIGIMAAAAAPSFIRMMRDRRVQSLALRQVDMLRLARTRAMGRGAAQLFRWQRDLAAPSSATTPGRMQLREAVKGGTGDDQFLPSSSCFAPNWSNTSSDSRAVSSFDDRRVRYEWAQPVMRDPVGTEVPIVEFCFTPRGRTFVRESLSGSFTALTSVYRFEVTNTETGLVRQVIIPPNGAARLESRL
jgi:type II secretory pathway pseudopilin PulG